MRLLLERAQGFALQAPRKHHVVPASYLARWGRKGVIRVTDLQTRKAYRSSPQKVARRTDYYRLESPDLDAADVPPLLVELILGSIEGPAVQAINGLQEPGYPWLFERDPSKAVDMALFIAIQLTRGERYRAHGRALANHIFTLQNAEMSDEQIRRLLRAERQDSAAVADARRFLDGLKTGEYHVEPQQAVLVGEALQMGVDLAPLLFDREWIIFRTMGRLVTTDEPVLMLGGRGIPRTESGGIGTAGVIAFPLGPHRLLAMFRWDADVDDLLAWPVLDVEETDALNVELINHASRWVFESPSGTVGMNAPRRPVPPPFLTEEINIAGNRTLIRNWRPSPWYRSACPPPLPVARWWDHRRWPLPRPPPTRPVPGRDDL